MLKNSGTGHPRFKIGLQRWEVNLLFIWPLRRNCFTTESFQGVEIPNAVSQMDCYSRNLTLHCNLKRRGVNTPVVSVMGNMAVVEDVKQKWVLGSSGCQTESRAFLVLPFPLSHVSQSVSCKFILSESMTWRKRPTQD